MNIDIIGGGVAGCVSALELAEQGYSVRIHEYRPELLTGSSHATPCRLTLGFHYFDVITAVRCLEASVAFVRKYPGFKIIDRLSDATHLAKGWYFITSDSLFKADEVLDLYHVLQTRYTLLIEKDPKNAVFGPADQFVRVLEPSEYQDQVSVERIVLGIETAECTLDFPRFRDFLIQEIRKHKGIQVFTNQQILKIRQAENHEGFSLLLKEQDSLETVSVETDFVINSAWESIEALNEASGFPMVSERTVRTKGMIQVRLPESLNNAHSMFFCFGPHCSFTNLGPGPEGYSRGFITSEPSTNIEQTTKLSISDHSRRLVYEGPTAEEVEELSAKIIEHAANFIPGMSEAQCIGASFGFVKNEGQVDIHSPHSASNKRRESGISEQQFGWISNASMKLLLCLENARAVVALVHRHELALKNIHVIAEQKATHYFEDKGRATMTHLFEKHLQQHALKRASDKHKGMPHISENGLHFSRQLSKVIESKEASLCLVINGNRQKGL